ncbi:MAG: hypothetical protein K0R28_986 [Paenibacillus sp.]|nr:hypothetical protein [Paenibacillus sp.]
MKVELSVEERDVVFQSLSDEQRHFLNHEMLRSRRTVFAQMMAKAKGADIPEGASYEDVERFLDGWIYTGYRDAGMVSSDYPCDCGRPLRYQHQVQHKATGNIMHFGIVHLGEHLKLDAKTVSLIKQGFDVLDQEMDEILAKVRDKWTMQAALSIPIPEGFPIPQDIQAHMEARLPLLDRQIVRLRKKLIDYMDQAMLRREAASKKAGPTVPPYAAPDIFVKPEQVTMLFPGEVEGLSVPETIDRNSRMNYTGSEVLLETSLMPKVEELLRSGVQSARVIAEILIREGVADQRRYSSGKPHLYVPVCMYIDSELIPRGYCQLLSNTLDDRLYRCAV